MKILGITDINEWIRKAHSKRVRKGMLSKWKERITKRRWELRHGRLRWKGERGRFEHSRIWAKSRYGKRLKFIGYTRYGILPPLSRGTRYTDYLIALNLLSYGYHVSGGYSLSDPDLLKGRWDLEERDWNSFWKNFPPELRNQFRLVRNNPDGPFSYENVRIERKPSRQG